MNELVRAAASGIVVGATFGIPSSPAEPHGMKKKGKHSCKGKGKKRGHSCRGKSKGKK